MKYDKEKNKNKGWIVFGIVFVILLVVIGAIFTFWLAPHIFFKQVDSAHEIIEKTYDADNAIYNYEWFKTQYEKIQATEKQIDNTAIELDNFKEMYGDAKDWDWQTTQSYGQLQTTLLGQKNHYEEIVAEYNARAKMANRNIFQDSLPFNVDKRLW